MGNFNMLPEEIMLEMLSRLPTESVLECKLVSKPWRNVVHHPSFSQLHLNHLNDFDSGKLSCIFYSIGSDNQLSYTEYDEISNSFSRITRINLRPPFDYDSILGSCNGLICFSPWYDKINEPVYICNPINRECIVLPKFQGKEFLSGFGYIPSTKEYKVVVICNSRRDPEFGIVQVYSLGSGIGLRNVEKMDYDVMCSKHRGVFLNGAIHWMNIRGTILSFGLADEEFHKLISLPCLPLAANPPFLVRLQVLGDFLCAYCKSPGGWHIWVLKKNRSNQDMLWSEEFNDFSDHIKLRAITFTKSGGLISS